MKIFWKLSHCCYKNAAYALSFLLPFLISASLHSQTSLLWSESAGTAASSQKSFVAVDLLGNIYMASCTTASNGLDWKINSVIKYSASTGTQTWVTAYAGTYGGHDAGVSLVVDASSYIYITGYTQTGSTTYDYVTARYQNSGTLSWAQTYNGPGSGVDEARCIIQDGDDVVVTGKSTGSSTGLDVCTISMAKSSGSVNWTMRYAGASSGTDCGYSLARDEMGNVLVAANEPSSSNYANICIKYFQKAKNDAAINHNLEVLAKGFSDLVTDTVFKRVIWYNILRGFDDSIYVMYADKLRALGDAAGVTATSKISGEIAVSYSWNSSYNWAVIISKQMWNARGKVYPLMGVPKLYQFSKSGFISATANTAFTYFEDDYPIGSPTTDEAFLTEEDIVGKGAWVFFTSIPVFVFAPEKPAKAIMNCFAGQNLVYPYTCNVCPPITPTPYFDNDDGGAADHEIGVKLYFDDLGDTCASLLDGNTNDDVYPGNCDCISSSYYAVVDALPGNYWIKEQDPIGQVTLIKCILPPIVDADGAYPLASGNQHSNRITLCSDESLFFDYGSVSPGADRFGLGFGGIYKLSRPGIPGVHPMYFYFSPFRGFNYMGGPDMNLNYGGDLQSNFCLTTVLDYEQDASLENCGYAEGTDINMGLTTPKDYFANPDASALQTYWSDNVIAVGIGNYNADVRMNFVEFAADTTGTTCNPGTLGDVGALVTTLQCYDATSMDEGDRYETIEFFDNDSVYAQGTRFLVHVHARFANGETINACQYITTNSNSAAYETGVVMIRGDIEDYSSSQVSYKIDVYETF